jgi:hypothetical protein
VSRLVPLTQDKYAIVDDEDYELVTKHSWYAHKGTTTFYACRNVHLMGRKTIQRMHAFITGYNRCDHINGNGLDNQRSNLREVTAAQNNRNRRKTTSITTSKYKGVHWVTRRSKWQAKIYVNGLDKFLGYFHDEKAAAIAYNKAAIRYFGEFCSLNIIEGD